jgi:spectinomycin phosphotransferase/16S rRNA (guanine(1405)-N(7))-methyltransferase
VFTRPADVDDADVVGVLSEGWGLGVVDLDYLAVGFGSHHWRATTASASWFVTVDDLVAKCHEPSELLLGTRERLVAALTTAAALRDAGFDFVVAPIRTNDDRIAANIGDRYVVAVYPNLDGETYDYGNYSDAAHRDSVLRHLATLHRAPTSCRRWALTDTFSIPRRAALHAACSQLEDRWTFGPFAEPARCLLARHVDAMVHAFDKYDALAAAASSQPSRFALTHGEPHPANTITIDRGVVLVDWDTALIAPPERDLWDLVGEEPSVSIQYEDLTGIGVDHDAIELYRLKWDLSEIAIYISDFRRAHDQTDDTHEAWNNLQHFLDPTRW